MNLENDESEESHVTTDYICSELEETIPSGPVIDDDGRYGELVLLGYNGISDSSLRGGNVKRHRSKMTLMRRAVGNGIKKANVSAVSLPAKDAPAVQDCTRHVVSYAYKGHTVLVEYASDPNKDLFQIGRSSEDQIDFTIVDTWLACGQNMPGLPGKSGRTERPISSTISRYACRILIDRDNCNKSYLYAAGFDASRNIFLGEKATKWTKKNSEVDGLTTNGVLILHPNRCTEDGSDDDNGDPTKMYVWREVSVDGDIYTLRETRSSNSRGELVPEETNMLQDGTLIDLCGATLLWRTADGLARSPSARELEMSLDKLNAGKPQCPVNLNTLIIPRKKSSKATCSSRQPYVYLRCGHVQGRHEWGMNVSAGGTRTTHKCPVCLVESERVVGLTMGMESAFHLDSGSLDHAFNPCGHVASVKTVRYWSRIPLPHGTNSFHPVCPFCTTLLATEKPFVRLIFQKMHLRATLRDIATSVPGIEHIWITDREGVPLLGTGEDHRMRTAVIMSHQATVDQIGKMKSGEYRHSCLYFASHQIIVLNMAAVYVYMFCKADANSAFITKIRERLEPIVDELNRMFEETLGGAMQM